MFREKQSKSWHLKLTFVDRHCGAVFRNTYAAGGHGFGMRSSKNQGAERPKRRE
jgi:hypothetical protein